MLDQELFTVWFVMTSRIVEFGRVENLSGIVKNNPSADELNVNGNSELYQALEQEFCGFSDKFDMSQKARRRVQELEELYCRCGGCRLHDTNNLGLPYRGP